MTKYQPERNGDTTERQEIYWQIRPASVNKKITATGPTGPKGPKGPTGQDKRVRLVQKERGQAVTHPQHHEANQRT